MPGRLDRLKNMVVDSIEGRRQIEKGQERHITVIQSEQNVWSF